VRKKEAVIRRASPSRVARGEVKIMALSSVCRYKQDVKKCISSTTGRYFYKPDNTKTGRQQQVRGLGCLVSRKIGQNGTIFGYSAYIQ